MPGEVELPEVEVLETEDSEDRDGEVVRPRPDGWSYADDEVDGCVKYEKLECCRGAMADLGLAGGDSALLFL